MMTKTKCVCKILVKSLSHHVLLIPTLMAMHFQNMLLLKILVVLTLPSCFRGGSVWRPEYCLVLKLMDRQHNNTLKAAKTVISSPVPLVTPLNSAIADSVEPKDVETDLFSETRT